MGLADWYHGMILYCVIIFLYIQFYLGHRTSRSVDVSYWLTVSTALKYIFNKKIPAEFPDFSWRWSRSTGGTLWLLQTASSFVSDDDYDFDDNDSWYPIHCVKVCGKIFIELSSSPRHLALLTQPNHKPYIYMTTFDDDTKYNTPLESRI